MTHRCFQKKLKLRLHFRVCVSCYSLVEEGKQVSHDDKGFAWQSLQDFFNVDSPVLEAFHGWNTP